MSSLFERVLVTPLRRISTPGGDVLHAIKATDEGFAGFGEAYFTTIHKGAVKGWKRHRVMVLNLAVSTGAARFVLHDDVSGEFRAVDLSSQGSATYSRLTVPPGLWMAFTGTGPCLNLILNVASITHDPAEADNAPLEAFAWDWSA